MIIPFNVNFFFGGEDKYLVYDTQLEVKAVGPPIVGKGTGEGGMNPIRSTCAMLRADTTNSE